MTVDGLPVLQSDKIASWWFAWRPSTVNRQPKKRLSYSESLFYEGAKRWSFGSWFQLV